MTEYTYDANGNMTRDRNKGIHSITYNMLNLPETILFNDGHETRYTYAADGRKLRVEHRLNNFAIIDAPGEGIEIGGGGIFNPRALNEVTEELVDDSGDIPAIEEPMFTTLMTRDYCSNYIYRNGALERVLTDNGYIEDGEMFFYVKDYQGNVRVVLNQSNQPVELNSYYPYGGLMGATTTEGTQPYKYSAKELDRENGIDLYDSNARWYDSMLGRTTTPDPLAEKYYSMSPYMWCAGNPFSFTAPTGKALHISNSESYQILTYSLPKWAREYVIMDDNGYIIKESINNEVFKSSQSGNIQALRVIVNDSKVVDFDATSTSFHYYNTQTGEEEPYMFEAPTRINNFKQLMDAYDGAPDLKDSYATFLKSNGIEDVSTVNGNMGQALRPIESQTEYPSPIASISSNFKVYINPVGTSLLERIKAVGHELFGHIYMSLIGKDPRHGKNNSQLEDVISERERESVNNY